MDNKISTNSTNSDAQNNLRKVLY